MKLTADQFNRLMDGARRSTADDVSVTSDGRRLDTPEKLRAWLEEYNAAHPIPAS